MIKYLRVKMGKHIYDIPADFIARKRADYYVWRDLEKSLDSGDSAGQPMALPPLKDGHPMIGKECFICPDPLEIGQETTLIPTYPGDDGELEKMEAGEAYTSIAQPAHWRCFLMQRHKDRIVGEIEKEVNHALKFTVEIIDWAGNNMNWSDVREVAILIETEQEDLEKYWINAEMEIIEKEED